MAKFELKLRKRNNPPEDLLEDLRSVAAAIGQDTVTRRVYDDKGKFGANTFLRRFGSWNGALKAAELKVVLRLNVSDEELFENLAELWQRLGRQPVGKDVEKGNGFSKFSLGTYEKRYGSWNKALEAFVKFINEEERRSEGGSKSEIKAPIRARMEAPIWNHTISAGLPTTAIPLMPTSDAPTRV
jgi:hypothetical protein